MGHSAGNQLNGLTPFFDGNLCQLYRVDSDASLIVKSLKSEYSDISMLLERFTNEALIVRSLQCRLAPIFISKHLDLKQPYYTYRYINGLNLAQLIMDCSLSFTASLEIIRQLLTTLSCLHERKQQVIHSDISPDNIIVTQDGEAHIIDFGCACLLDESRFAADTWIGKHAYLSPEQAQGQSWGVQSDIYQVGLVLYEMLAGIRFNRGHTDREQLPLAAHPPPLVLDHIDSRLHPFLERILHPSLHERFASARDALSELNKI